MIVADRKPLNEIIDKIARHKKVLVAGCATCVAECRSGGEKETELLASQLRIAFNEKKAGVEITECCIERQCEPELIEKCADKFVGIDAVLSLACGVGVQQMSERLLGMPVYPGLNTMFMGTHASPGTWEERCAGCGNCILDKTGGICPIARCSKSLLNGPCGGTRKEGKCEISEDIPCAWALIVERMMSLNRMAELEDIIPSKDWTSARDGGPRTLTREELA